MTDPRTPSERPDLHPKPSTTALGVAALRAAHQVIDAEPRILDDPVAIRLLDPGALETMLERRDRFAAPGALGLRAHVLLRSRYAEDCLAESAAAGVRQYVVLGAGLDTFAYRQPPWARDLAIYEVDLPATQAAKRARLAEAGVGVPANVHYAAVDLIDGDLFGALANLGFRQSERAVFTLLGVTMYLTRDGARQLYRTVASAAPGSVFVLTFAQPRADGVGDHLAERAAAAGEPWLNRSTTDELVRELHTAGFAVVEPLSVDEVERRYFHDRSDGLRAPRRVSLVRAVV